MRLTQLGSHTQPGNERQAEVSSHESKGQLLKQQSFVVSCPFKKATEDNICASLVWSDERQVWAD